MDEQIQRCSNIAEKEVLIGRRRELDLRNDFFVPRNTRIKQLQTGAVGIWKGDLWIGGSALLHRMPRTGSKRLRFMAFVN